MGLEVVGVDNHNDCYDPELKSQEKMFNELVLIVLPLPNVFII